MSNQAPHSAGQACNHCATGMPNRRRCSQPGSAAAQSCSACSPGPLVTAVSAITEESRSQARPEQCSADHRALAAHRRRGTGVQQEAAADGVDAHGSAVGAACRRKNLGSGRAVRRKKVVRVMVAPLESECQARAARLPLWPFSAHRTLTEINSRPPRARHSVRGKTLSLRGPIGRRDAAASAVLDRPPRAGRVCIHRPKETA